MEPAAYNALNFGVVHPNQAVEAAAYRLPGTQFTITLCSQVSVALSTAHFIHDLFRLFSSFWSEFIDHSGPNHPLSSMRRMPRILQAMTEWALWSTENYRFPIMRDMFRHNTHIHVFVPKDQ